MFLKSCSTPKLALKGLSLITCHFRKKKPSLHYLQMKISQTLLLFSIFFFIEKKNIQRGYSRQKCPDNERAVIYIIICLGHMPNKLISSIHNNQTNREAHYFLVIKPYLPFFSQSCSIINHELTTGIFLLINTEREREREREREFKILTQFL